VRRPWKLLLAAALVTLVVLATGAMRHHTVSHKAVVVQKAGPVGPRLFGFNDNSVLMQQADPETDIARNVAAGATVIRYTVNWDYVEPKQGQFNWNGYDPLYTSALKRGIRPILVVLGSPSWARPTDLTCFPNLAHCRRPPDTNHNQAFTDFVTTLVKRYPQAAALEVWNEPNLTEFWAGTLDVARYAQLVDLAYAAVKQAEPSMPVLGGALNNSEYDAPGTINYPNYLQLFLEQKPHMDALSIHDYPHAGSDPTWYEETLDTARSNLDKAGLTTMPVWVTELGVSTTGDGAATPADQATRLIGMLAELDKRQYVKAAVIHTMIPPPGPADNIEYGFAVLNADGSTKPAYCAIRAARKATGPSLCPQPPPTRTLRACSARQHRASCSRSSSSARSSRQRRHQQGS
jgi:hypothetical protein